MKLRTVLRLASVAVIFLAGCKAGVPSTDDDEEELVINPRASSGSCGKERWSVKTGTDADASKVNLTPVAGSVASLIALAAPNPIPLSNRVAPTELQAVTLTNVTLKQYKLENDSDYHIDITDGPNSMITEIPDPACVGAGSVFASSITAARAAFDKAHPGISGTFTPDGETVTITGVPFFDFLHGQAGVAPNGIELHAILSICFGKDCAGGGTSNPDFSLAASAASVTGAGGVNVGATPSGGFSGAIALAVSGVPSGAKATLSASSIAANGSATLTLDPGTAAAGTANLTITGTSGALSHTATVAWTIPAASTQFAITANPSSVTGAGSSTISAQNALPGGVSLTLSGVPSGATAGFRPLGDGSNVLMLTPGSAAAGSYAVVVTGVHAGQTATATVQWTIASSDFALSVSPASQTVAPGNSVAYSVSTSGVGQVSLSASGLPAGATASFSPASVTAGQGSTLSVAVAASAAAGTTAFHVDGSSAAATHSAAATLVISSAADTTPPVAQITSPASGATVSGSVAIAASATDNVGVTRMEIDADGAAIGSGAGASLTASWDTSAAKTGTHTLTAKAWDAAGNVGTSAAVTVTVARTAGLKTVFIILMENHNWSSIQGSSSAPYINNTLLPQASYATQYFNAPGIHPSEPNYLWLEAGTNFGILNDGLPSANHQSTTQHLVTLLENKGLTWKSYQEDISGTTCPLTNSGLYAPKHNAFVFFDDVTNGNSASSSRCIAHVRPYTELAGDLTNNTVANYNFITPNLCDDMHNSVGCSTLDAVANGDTWLSQAVPAILASSAYQNGGALLITWDESEGGDVPIGMIVLSPQAKGGGYNNSIKYTHGSTLRSLQEIFGVTPFLGDAASESDLSDLFKTFP